MPWENNSGGPWGGQGGGNRGGNGGGGGGGPRSPWGKPGGGGGGGRGPGGQPPDVEELVRKGQEKLKSMIPGGMGMKGGIAIGLVVVLIWLASGFYRVGADEQGVELVFGKMNQITGPGLNYNVPAPIGEVFLPRVTAVNTVEIGFNSATGRTTATELRAESLMLTGDENIIDIQFVVFWKIRDAQDFLFNVRNPEQSVKNAAEAAMREIVGKSAFEYIRTRGRNAVARDAQARIQQILDDYGAGIEITQVNPQKFDPPGQVLDAFRDVQAANAERESKINQATGQFNEVTQRAEGQAQQILREAEAYKEERVNQAQGDTQRFLSVLTEYTTAPDITKRRIYLETMEEVMERMNKVLIENNGSGDGSGVVPYLPLNQLTNPGRGASQ